ncbi:MAG TPA: hypothetical protein VJS14_16460, partial [Enterobacteriaceae bacterium]|nr:hypothetical protein [Enterobacteriaceae bacterium]
KGGASLQGGGDEKTCKIFTDQQGPGVIDVTVKGTALKADQLPPHSHNVRHTWNTGSGAGGTTSITVGNEKNPARREMIDAYGDPAKEHTHSASATVGTHAHSFTSLPAYYILAFIMKL